MKFAILLTILLALPVTLLATDSAVLKNEVDAKPSGMKEKGNHADILFNGLVILKSGKRFTVKQIQYTNELLTCNTTSGNIETHHISEIQEIRFPVTQTQKKKDEPCVEKEVKNYRIGDTITNAYTSLSMKLLKWRRSTTAINGPYNPDTYYKFTVSKKSNQQMIFYILTYRLTNTGNREISTPHIVVGEVKTNKGRFYKAWSPPVGIHSKEYNPKQTTLKEAQRQDSTSAAYKKLLPEQSIVGSIVFEVPQTETPVSVELVRVDMPILLK